jgi:hypothetical protein
MTAHNLIIVHTMVGYLYSTDAMFREGGYSGTESHYGLGGRWGSDAEHHLDGAVWQWQDRGRQADANLEANPQAISIETADNAPGGADDITGWTAKQAAALVTLLAWECSVEAHRSCPDTWACRHGMTWHGIRVAIPPELVPDSRPHRRGLAYHRQGIDPWRVDGGQRWSTARGKECPGPVRIRQFTREIIPAVQARLRGEDVLTTEDKKWLSAEIERQITAALPKVWVGSAVDLIEVLRPQLTSDLGNAQWQPHNVLARMLDDGWKILDRLAAQDKALAALSAAVSRMLEQPADR